MGAASLSGPVCSEPADCGWLQQICGEVSPGLPAVLIPIAERVLDPLAVEFLPAGMHLAKARGSAHRLR